MEQLPKLLFCIDGVDTSLGNLRTLDWPQKQQKASSMTQTLCLLYGSSMDLNLCPRVISLETQPKPCLHVSPWSKRSSPQQPWFRSFLRLDCLVHPSILCTINHVARKFSRELGQHRVSLSGEVFVVKVREIVNRHNSCLQTGLRQRRIPLVLKTFREDFSHSQ